MRLMRSTVLAITSAVVLAGCADTGLRDLKSDSSGPDEFQVQTVKPLQQPAGLTTLPVPTPGGANLVDQRPIDDAATALGGRAAGSPTGPIPGSDGAVVTYASRFGVAPDIRQSLAAEDAKFRKNRGRFTQIRIVPVDQYNKVYKKFAIDPFEVADSFRRAGIRPPSSPP